MLRNESNYLQRTLSQLSASESQFRLIASALPQLVFRTHAEGTAEFFNDAWYEFTGMVPGSADEKGWINAIHPEDRDRIDSIWNETLHKKEANEVEFRLQHFAGGHRWVLTRATPVTNGDGTVNFWLGTSTDIHTIKTLDEQRQLALEEMNHRVKNTMTMVQAVVSQTLRNAETLQDATAAVEGRILAMAGAHDNFIKSKWVVGNVDGVVAAALAPHRPGTGRFDIKGPPLEIGASQAMALTMALHELGTNATKYGALSNTDGRVSVRWDVLNDGSTFAFHWLETGGPKVTAPNSQGFGSRMIEKALAGYFSGTATLDFAPDGLRFELLAPVKAMVSGGS